jgi:predicted TIM-barrel fold metal-dependent hydrolase
MIIDFHAHLWGRGFIPPAFYKETARQWAEKSPDRTPDMILSKLLEGVVDEDGKLFIENMNQAGVDMTVINISDMEFYRCGEEPEVTLDKQIEFYGELQKKYPERLQFFFFADPRRKNCVELLEKAVKDYGFIGCGEFTSDTLYVTDDVVQPRQTRQP